MLCLSVPGCHQGYYTSLALISQESIYLSSYRFLCYKLVGRRPFFSQTQSWVWVSLFVYVNHFKHLVFNQKNRNQPEECHRFLD